MQVPGLRERRCQARAPGLTEEQRAALRVEVPEWREIDGVRIEREYRFGSYLEGVEWVRQIARLADEEDHHPEIVLLYRKVRVGLWTHTAKGLSENDYILAAKFDHAYATRA